MRAGIPPELLSNMGSFFSDPVDYFRFKRAIDPLGDSLSNVFILSTANFHDYDLNNLRALLGSGCNVRVRGAISNHILQKLIKCGYMDVLFDYIGSLPDGCLTLDCIVDLLFHACRLDSPELFDLVKTRSFPSEHFSNALNTTRGYDSLLTAAIANKSRRMMCKLIHLGFDTDRVIGGSVSPLGVALWSGDVTIVDYLLNVSKATMVSSRTSIFDFLQSKTMECLPAVTQRYVKDFFSNNNNRSTGSVYIVGQHRFTVKKGPTIHGKKFHQLFV